MVNSIDSPKQYQVLDQSGNMVLGTCMKCHSDIMGPPHDRGGDNTKTWHKYCNGCLTLVRRAEKPGKLKSDTRDSQPVEDVNEDRDVEGPKEGLKGTSGQGEYDGLTTSNETSDPSGKKWKTIFYGLGGTAVPGTCRQCNAEFLGPPTIRKNVDTTKTWFKLCGECNASQQRCKTSGSHSTRRPQRVNIRVTEEEDSGDEDVQSEGTSAGDQVKHLINDLDSLTTHAIVDDHQERGMMLDVLRSLNEEQMVTYNAIKLTNESMRTLMEQHVKTSSMIDTLLIQLMENDSHGDKPKEGAINAHTQLDVKRHGTSKVRIVKHGYKVW